MGSLKKRIEKLEQMSGKHLPQSVTFEVIGEGGKVTGEFKVPIKYGGVNDQKENR